MTPDPAAVELFEDATGDIALGDLDAAIEKYRSCVEMDPAYFDAWHALGMALMKSGRYPEAIEAGLKAVDLNPNDQLAWSSLSLFLRPQPPDQGSRVGGGEGAHPLVGRKDSQRRRPALTAAATTTVGLPPTR